MGKKNSKLKILYILPTLDFTGGMEACIINYFLNFSNKITADFIVYEYQDEYYKNIIESLGGNVYLVPKINYKNIFYFFKKLKQFFKLHHEYDIIHCNIINVSLFYFLIAKKYDIPIMINHSHQNAYGDQMSHIIRNYPLIKIGASMSNVNFACSRLAGDFIFKRKKYYIVNNAIDLKKFKYNIEDRKKFVNNIIFRIIHF